MRKMFNLIYGYMSKNMLHRLPAWAQRENKFMPGQSGTGKRECARRVRQMEARQ